MNSKMAQTNDLSDDAAVMATQLYEMHGYPKAFETANRYMNDAQNHHERFEWERIINELLSLKSEDTINALRP